MLGVHPLLYFHTHISREGLRDRAVEPQLDSYRRPSLEVKGRGTEPIGSIGPLLDHVQQVPEV